MHTVASPMLNGHHSPVGVGSETQGAGAEALRELGFSWVWWQSLTWFQMWPGPRGLRLHFCACFIFPCVYSLAGDWIMFGEVDATPLSWPHPSQVGKRHMLL